MGQSSLCVINYIDGASRRLNESTINKFINEFFAGLPEENLLSSSSRVSQSQRDEFARHVDDKEECYCCSKYELA